MKTGIKFAMVAAMLVCAFVAWRFYKRQPPYERGMHEVTASAEVNPTRTDSPRAGNCPVFPADTSGIRPSIHFRSTRILPRMWRASALRHPYTRTSTAT